MDLVSFFCRRIEKEEKGQVLFESQQELKILIGFLYWAISFGLSINLKVNYYFWAKSIINFKGIAQGTLLFCDCEVFFHKV